MSFTHRGERSTVSTDKRLTAFMRCGLRLLAFAKLLRLDVFPKLFIVRGTLSVLSEANIMCCVRLLMAYSVPTCCEFAAMDLTEIN